jgi:hypothetical protein
MSSKERRCRESIEEKTEINFLQEKCSNSSSDSPKIEEERKRRKRKN